MSRIALAVLVLSDGTIYDRLIQYDDFRPRTFFDLAAAGLNLIKGDIFAGAVDQQRVNSAVAFAGAP